MASRSESYEALKALVYSDDGHNEVECGNHLAAAADLLCRNTPLSIVKLEKENRSFFGSTDYLICALSKAGTGGHEKNLYVWELKSPQCEVMEKDNNKNRYRPSKYLVRAENQLLHYMYEAQGSDVMRERYELTSRSNIIAGGIIIGRDDLICRKGDSAEAARFSLNVRMKYFYYPNNIRLMTWDRVIEHITPST